MSESRPAQVRGWLADRRLRLARLDPGPRRAAVVGLALGGAAALAMIMPTWPGVALGEPTCTTSLGRRVAAIAGAVVSLAALAYGLALVGAAATAPGAASWRLSRTRFGLTLLLPTVLVLTAIVDIAAPTPSWLALMLNHLRGVLLFVALVLILTLAVATRGRGPRMRWGTGLVVAIGLAGVGVYILFTAALAGFCTGVLLVGSMLTVLGFFGFTAVAVLLVWLAAEGLRLSGSLTSWAMERRPEGSLLRLLLGVKVLGMAVAVVLVLTGLAPAWLAGFRPTLSTWVFSAVLVALVCLLLSAEERLVGSAPEDYALVTRWFGLLVVIAIAFLPADGIVAAIGSLPGRPSLVLALVGTAVTAVLVGLLYHRRGAGAIVLVTTGLVVSYGLLTWAWLGQRARAPGDDLAGGMGRTLLVAAVSLLLAMAATVVGLITRPPWRRHIAFGIGLLVWIAANIGLPVATGGRLGSDPVTFDILLTLVIAVLAVAGRAGWQRALTTDELVLLLVTTSVIIELPLLIGALPDVLNTPLLVFAFLSPGLAAVTLEAAPLNDDPADAPFRVHTTIGLLCVGYGLVSAMALAVRDPLPLLQDLVGFFNGVAAVPFAVVLVAVISANRRRADALASGRTDPRGVVVTPEA